MKYFLILLFSSLASAQLSNPNVRISTSNGSLVATKQAGTALSSTDYTLATKAIIDSGIFSIGGVSTTSILNVSTTGTVNVSSTGTIPTSLQGVSTTSILNTSILGVSTTSLFRDSIQSVSTTDVLRTNIQGVSTTGVMNTSVLGVSTTSILNTSLLGVSTTSALNVGIIGVSTTGTLSVSETNILPNFTTTATVSSPNLATFNFVVKTSNNNRKGLQIMNTSDSNCWVKYGTAATSTTSTVYMIARTGYFNMPYPIYTGELDGICSVSATTGALNVTEQ